MKFVSRISYLVYSLVIVCLFFVAQAQAASVVSSEELLKNLQEYDGQEVIFKGEVIGDIMVRGESAWVNVRDEAGAIGAFCLLELTEKIEYRGSYGFKGDTISVRGKFYRACGEHGGDSDIHAEKIFIVEKGKEILHPLDPQKVKLSIILPAVALLLAIIYLIARRFR